MTDLTLDTTNTELFHLLMKLYEDVGPPPEVPFLTGVTAPGLAVMHRVHRALDGIDVRSLPGGYDLTCLLCGSVFAHPAAWLSHLQTTKHFHIYPKHVQHLLKEYAVMAAINERAVPSRVGNKTLIDRAEQWGCTSKPRGDETELKFPDGSKLRVKAATYHQGNPGSVIRDVAERCAGTYENFWTGDAKPPAKQDSPQMWTSRAAAEWLTMRLTGTAVHRKLIESEAAAKGILPEILGNARALAGVRSEDDTWTLGPAEPNGTQQPTIPNLDVTPQRAPDKRGPGRPRGQHGTITNRYLTERVVAYLYNHTGSWFTYAQIDKAIGASTVVNGGKTIYASSTVSARAKAANLPLDHPKKRTVPAKFGVPSNLRDEARQWLSDRNYVFTDAGQALAPAAIRATGDPHAANVEAAAARKLAAAQAEQLKAPAEAPVAPPAAPAAPVAPVAPEQPPAPVQRPAGVEDTADALLELLLPDGSVPFRLLVEVTQWRDATLTLLHKLQGDA